MNLKIPHNSRRWTSYTNRHRTTAGQSWGWLEGLPGNVCWSNDSGSSYTGAQAFADVKEHNEWLDAQRSVTVRLLEMHEEEETIRTKLNTKIDEITSIQKQLANCLLQIELLNNEAKP